MRSSTGFGQTTIATVTGSMCRTTMKSTRARQSIATSHYRRVGHVQSLKIKCCLCAVTGVQVAVDVVPRPWSLDRVEEWIALIRLQERGPRVRRSQSERAR